MKKQRNKVLPKSVFIFLCGGFFIYLGYIMASLIAPDGVVDEFILNLPVWIKILFFMIIGGYLVFELLNSLYGASINKEK